MADPAERGIRFSTVRIVIRVGLSVLITAVCALWLLHEGRLEDYQAAIGKTHIWPLLAGAGCLVLIALARGVRLSIVAGCSFGVRLLRVSVVHNFISTLAPARLGELALPVLLARGWQVPMTQAFGALLTVRIYDLLVLLAVGSLATVMAFGTLEPVWSGVGLIALALATMTALILPRVVQRLVGLLNRRGRGGRLVDSLLGLSQATIKVRGRLALLLVVTFGIWLLMIATFHSISRAYGITAPWSATTLGVTAAAFAFILPVNGVGSLGPSQILWATVLRRFGVDFETAVVAGIVTQVLALTLHGGMALVLLWIPAASTPNGNLSGSVVTTQH